MIVVVVSFSDYHDLLDLHVLTHSVPTRRSFDLHQQPRRPLHRRFVDEEIGLGSDLAAILADDPHTADEMAQRAGLIERGFDRGRHAILDHRPTEAEDRGMFEARSEEHTSELQSLMRISYAVFCLKKKKDTNKKNTHRKTNNI